MKVHILGICGTFMASLAGIALQMGYKVTGQDKQYYDPMKSLLNELGINEEISVDASKNLIQSDLVIIGNAISRGNPAAEYILNNRLKKFIIYCLEKFIMCSEYSLNNNTSEFNVPSSSLRSRF